MNYSCNSKKSVLSTIPTILFYSNDQENNILLKLNSIKRNSSQYFVKINIPLTFNIDDEMSVSVVK